MLHNITTVFFFSSNIIRARPTRGKSNSIFCNTFVSDGKSDVDLKIIVDQCLQVNLTASIDLFPFLSFIIYAVSIILCRFNFSAKVTLSADSDSAYSVSGGGLPAAYNAAQFHFHWGSDDTKGSEHTVSGKEFPMEVTNIGEHFFIESVLVIQCIFVQGV